MVFTGMRPWGAGDPPGERDEINGKVGCESPAPARLFPVRPHKGQALPNLRA